MTLCGISLGGNLNDTSSTFVAAIRELETCGSVLAVSDFVRTPAMGESAGDDFLNAALTLETNASAAALLTQLHAIEAGLGRERTIRWGPRTLDLDLLFYGATVLDTPQVVVPHPCLWFRRFVLEPLCEVAPDWRHPVLHESVQQMVARLNAPIVLSVDIADSSTLSVGQIAQMMASDFANVRLTTDLGDQDFSRIVVSSATAHADGCQPHHPSGRVLEFSGSAQEVLSDIRDVLVAIGP